MAETGEAASGTPGSPPTGEPGTPPPESSTGKPAEPAAEAWAEPPPAVVTEPLRSDGVGRTKAAAPPGPYGRAPMVALFLGGFLTCLGLVLSVLALNGTIAPLSSGQAVGPTASPIASPAPGASATPPSSPVALPTQEALVTPAPIVKPTVLTPTDLASGYALGRADAKVAVDVWEDFQCPYCRRFTQQVEPQIVSTYVETGKIRFVYRDLSFLGEESAWATVAAALAEQQGKFWPYHDYLFANQLGENVGSFSVARLEMIADAVGLDRAAFDAGMQVDAARTLFSQVNQASSADATKLGISSTPTIVVNGTVVQGNDWAAVKAAIDAALAAAG